VDRASELLLAREEALGKRTSPGGEPHQPKRSRKSQKPGKSRRSTR
jgi:hypothetical protein